MKTYRIASIPGDGIGNEVIPAGIEVLRSLAAREAFRLEFQSFDWSSKRYKDKGAYIPEGGLDELKKFDAIFFGAVVTAKQIFTPDLGGSARTQDVTEAVKSAL